jgi:hypothetical protein
LAGGLADEEFLLAEQGIKVHVIDTGEAGHRSSFNVAWREREGARGTNRQCRYNVITWGAVPRVIGIDIIRHT